MDRSKKIPMRSGPSEVNLPATRETPPQQSQFEILTHAAAKEAAKALKEAFTRLPQEYSPADGKDRLDPGIEALTGELETQWTVLRTLNPTSPGNERETNTWDIEAGKTVQLRQRLVELKKHARIIRQSQQILRTLGDLPEDQQAAWVKKHIQEKLRAALKDPIVRDGLIWKPLFAAMLDRECLPAEIALTTLSKDISGFRETADNILNALLEQAKATGYVPASTTLTQLKQAIA